MSYAISMCGGGVVVEEEEGGVGVGVDTCPLLRYIESDMSHI